MEKSAQEVVLTVSSSPHVRCNESIPKIMWTVVATLVPAAAFGVYYFGFNALLNIIVSILSAVFCDWALAKFIHKKMSIHYG